jgi:hypothetical protein
MQSKIQHQSVWTRFVDEIGVLFGAPYDPKNPIYSDAPKPDKPLIGAKKPPTKTTEELPKDVDWNSNINKFERQIDYDFAVTPADIKADKLKNVADTTTKTADKDTDTLKSIADKPTDKVAWQILTTPTKTADLTGERQITLTVADIAELKKRGLDLAKAQVIKEEWYEKQPRNVAAFHLKPKGKGYHASEIGLYYAVFNFTLKASASPTLQEK